MNPLLIYMLLLKATLTSFNGMAGLAIVHNDFVVERHAITSEQLNTAIAVSRSVPGPNGGYLVCVGYFAGGLPGAAAGLLAMLSPAFLAIPLLLGASRYAEHPLLKSAISATLLASAGLLAATALQLAQTTITTGFDVAVAAASFGLMAATTVDTVWLMAGAALVGLLGKWASGR